PFESPQTAKQMSPLRLVLQIRATVPPDCQARAPQIINPLAMLGCVVCGGILELLGAASSRRAPAPVAQLRPSDPPAQPAPIAGAAPGAARGERLCCRGSNR